MSIEDDIGAGAGGSLFMINLLDDAETGSSVASAVFKLCELAVAGSHP